MAASLSAAPTFFNSRVLDFDNLRAAEEFFYRSARLNGVVLSRTSWRAGPNRFNTSRIAAYDLSRPDLPSGSRWTNVAVEKSPAKLKSPRRA